MTRMKLMPHSLILLWGEKNTFGTLKVMVLKHTPLGEINLPSVATDAFIPRRHAKLTKKHKKHGRRARAGGYAECSCHISSAR